MTNASSPAGEHRTLKKKGLRLEPNGSRIDLEGEHRTLKKKGLRQGLFGGAPGVNVSTAP